MPAQHYEIKINSQMRLPMIDSGKLSVNKQHMYGLIEIDITTLRAKIKDLRKQKKGFSLNACLIKIIGDCIGRNKFAQAILINKRKMIVFDDVDISLPIERKIGDDYFPFPLIIRGVNKKTVYEIDKEISNEVEKNNTGNANPVLGGSTLGKIMFVLFYNLPQRLRVAIVNILVNNPFQMKKFGGTVGVTTVNMAGRMSGWVIPNRNPYNLYFAIGSISKKPLVVNDEIKIRDVLNLTVCFNHNTIDGSPAKRFMNDLIHKIENGIV